VAGYSLFGPFALIRELPAAEALSHRARRFVDGGAISGPVRLTRYGEPKDKLSRKLVRQALWGARLSHPAVARILEVGVLEGQLYTISEIAPGVDLRSCLLLSKEKKRPPPVAACLAIGAQIARLAREIYELGAGEQLLGHVRPEQVTLGWSGWVRVRATGTVPTKSKKQTRDPFLAPELSRGARPSLSTDTWTVARLLRAALAVDPEGRATPKVSAAYRDSLGPLLTSSLARKPSERMLMPALEERLGLILDEVGDAPRPAVAEWLRELQDPEVDADHEVIDEELLASGESIYVHADLPLLHYPSDEANSLASTTGDPFEIPHTGASSPGDSLSGSMSGSGEDPSRTTVGRRSSSAGSLDDIPSSVFGRILEEGAGQDEPSVESEPPSAEDVDLDAIALSSLDDQPPPEEDTKTLSPKPGGKDTALTDLSDLDVEVDVMGPQGTDVMRAPPEAVVSALRDSAVADDGGGVFAGDERLEDMFDDEDDGTRTDPTPDSDRPSHDSDVSAIFTRSMQPTPDLLSSVERSLKNARRRKSGEGPTRAEQAGRTSSMRRPSRDEMWSDLDTDAGQSPVDAALARRDEDDVFQNSESGPAAASPAEEDPDRTAYIDRPAAPDDRAPRRDATAAEDPDRTAYIDRPQASSRSSSARNAAAEEDPDRTAYIDQPRRIVSDDDEDEPTDFALSAPPANLDRDNWDDDEQTARLSADVAKAIAAGIKPGDEEAPQRTSASGWGDPLKSGRHKLQPPPDPDPGETALLPVHDVSELLGATNAPQSAYQESDEPRSIADVLPDDPELGMLVVDVPDTAVVFVNGKEQGRGRTVLADIDRFVSYVVRVHMRGHAPWTGTVTLRGMRAARIEPELEKRR
jgi:hypothetical protein